MGQLLDKLHRGGRRSIERVPEVVADVLGNPACLAN
jgi:hypothetical protein